MTTKPEHDNAAGELPALPKPEFQLRWDDQRAAYYVSKPNIGSQDCYTAEQIRERDAMWQSRLEALAASHCVQSEVVAEIVSAHGDPESFGERELKLLVGIQKLPYGTKLCMAPASQPADKPAWQADNSQATPARDVSQAAPVPSSPSAPLTDEKVEEDFVDGVLDHLWAQDKDGDAYRSALAFYVDWQEKRDSAHAPEPATAGDTLEDNVRYLLDHTPRKFVVRARPGGGMEDIIGSLCITWRKMQDAAEATPAAAVPDHLTASMGYHPEYAKGWNDRGAAVPDVSQPSVVPASQQAASDGVVLVPRIPTRAMADAALYALDEEASANAIVEEVYAAMIAAAPANRPADNSQPAAARDAQRGVPAAMTLHSSGGITNVSDYMIGGVVRTEHDQFASGWNQCRKAMLAASPADPLPASEVSQ